METTLTKRADTFDVRTYLRTYVHVCSKYNLHYRLHIEQMGHFVIVESDCWTLNMRLTLLAPKTAVVSLCLALPTAATAAAATAAAEGYHWLETARLRLWKPASDSPINHSSDIWLLKH